MRVGPPYFTAMNGINHYHTTEHEHPQNQYPKRLIVVCSWCAAKMSDVLRLGRSFWSGVTGPRDAGWWLSRVCDGCVRPLAAQFNFVRQLNTSNHPEWRCDHLADEGSGPVSSEHRCDCGSQDEVAYNAVAGAWMCMGCRYLFAELTSNRTVKTFIPREDR